MRHSWHSIGLIWVLVLVITGPVLGQMNRVFNDSSATEWLQRQRVERPEDPFSDQALVKDMRLHKGILQQYITIGERELSVHRRFAEGIYLQYRFREDSRKNFQWRLHMTDVVAIGTVQEVSDETEICEYGTKVVVDVSRYLKGQGGNTVVIKLISGKRTSEKKIILVHEPTFKVGEKVLVFLTMMPFRLHKEIISRPCPGQMDLFYLTNTGGSYFELGVAGTKKSIRNGRLDWKGDTRTLADVENEILADVDARF